MSDGIKLVPAICTRCGGAVEVDPAQETAICPFCGTQFIIEKAVHNYNVQHATIEHADHVNIDMTGSVKEVLDFVGNNMMESKEERMERRKQEAEQQKMMTAGFLKIFAIMIAAMMTFGIGYFIYLNATGQLGDANTVTSEAAGEAGQLECEVIDGTLVINITGQEDGEWAYQAFDSVRTKLSSENNDFGDYYGCTVADVEEGTGYVVTAYYEEGDTEFNHDPAYFSVVKVAIENWEITEALDSQIVDSLSEYDFE